MPNNISAESSKPLRATVDVDVDRSHREYWNTARPSVCTNSSQWTYEVQKLELEKTATKESLLMRSFSCGDRHPSAQITLGCLSVPSGQQIADLPSLLAPSAFVRTACREQGIQS